MRRLTLAAAITVVATPALLLVAEEIAALLTGRWSARAQDAADTDAAAPAADLLALEGEQRRWRRVDPAAIARALRATQTGRPVLLVHGLDEPGSIWFELAPALRSAGQTPLRIEYANDGPLHVAARSVRASLASLHAHGVVEVDIVAHSMGGLVVWDALAPPPQRGEPSADPLRSSTPPPLPAVRRLILIASPVHGAPLAHLRPFAEAREQLVRLLSPSLAFDAGAFLRDGLGQASLDLAPESDYLASLRARGAPAAAWVGAIIASLAPLEPAARPDSPAAMLGDGAVPTFACAPPWADEVRVIRGAHRFILKSLASPRAGRRAPPAPAVPLALEMLKAE